MNDAPTGEFGLLEASLFKPRLGHHFGDGKP